MNSKSKDKVEKLKILGIHGYRQNSESFRQKTGSFRKIVNKWADFTFVTAPHKVEVFENNEELNIGQSMNDEQYGWFFNKDDKTFRGTRTGGPAIGDLESIELIEQTFKEKGPFDGIWGFSQGACLVAILCDLQQKGLLNFKFDFAIMVAGFKSGSIPHLDYYKEPITIPNLHVFGTGDEIIPSSMSVDLTKSFHNPIIIEHSGGHFVPASSTLKESYQNFIKNQYSVKFDS